MISADRNPPAGHSFAIRRNVLAVPIALLAALLAATAWAAPDAKPAAGFSEGQKIEVREGDSWSAATVVKHEGRKFLIHYEGADAAADEWVTTDRMRVPGTARPPAPAAQPGPPAQPPTPAAAPAAPKPAKPPVVWNLHSHVEVKWGGLYSKATIVNKRGDWYLIEYDGWNSQEWVEPWRIRKVGSSDDPIGHAQPNPSFSKGKVGNPPSEKPGPAPDAPGANAPGGAPALDSAKTPLTDTDRAAVQDVVFGGGDVDAFQLAPDTQVKLAKPLVANPIALQGSTGGFFDHVTAIFFSSPDAAMAAAVHTDAAPGKPKRVRVERVDLAAGKSLNTAEILGDIEPLDISPDGKLLVDHSSGFGFGVSARLDVWQIDAAGEAAHAASFVPFDNRQPNNRDITWARFVDADHVLAMNGEGFISLWEWRKAKAIWSAQAEARMKPVLSGNGKYVAAEIKGHEILIAEALTGRTVGRLSIDGTWGLRLAFKPDGTQLAATGQDLLFVWDLTTGKKLHDLSPSGVVGQSVAWVGEGFILLDGRSLVWLDKKMVAWTYENTVHPGGENLCASFAGRYWYAAAPAGRGGKPALVSVTLPHEAARKAAMAINLDQEMIIKPGSTVSLDVAVAGEVQQKVTDSLTARLQQMGMTVAANAPVKLIARSEPGDTVEMQYHTFGAGFGGNQKMNVATTKLRLALETAGGKILWERRTATSPPPMLMMKQGQTIDQAVAEAMKPSSAFFEMTRIPDYVPKTSGGMGTSKLTAAGVQSPSVGL
ncbi:MAG: hypothetical protein JWN24_1342 [Phycisphaerales bacterium]|nr:hypothetical protein [Phycisphaerales bacterium]